MIYIVSSALVYCIQMTGCDGYFTPIFYGFSVIFENTSLVEEIKNNFKVAPQKEAQEICMISYLWSQVTEKNIFNFIYLAFS